MASVHSYTVKPDPKIKGDKGVRYFVVYMKPDGKQTKKRGFLRKADANAFGNQVEEKKRQGEYVAPARGKVTVGELAGPWLKGKQAKLKKSSYTHVEVSWRLHVKTRWERVKVSDITQEDVEAWITDMLIAAQQFAEERRKAGGKVSDGASKIRQAHTVLVGILDTAVKGKRLPKNPARGIENLPKLSSKKNIYLTALDVRRLAKEAGKHRTLVLTLAYCGIRWGEAVALRVRDIDFTKGRLSIHENAVQLSDGITVGTTKSNRVRSVPVPRFVLKELQALTEGRLGDALVFPHPKNPDEYLPRSKFDEGWFAGAVKRANIQRVTPHDLRHTCASLAVSAGANVMALSRMLGHKDASITLVVYADLFDTDLDRVADAMDKAYGVRAQNVATEPMEEEKAA